MINAGDLLARWSNDVIRSTLHRVVAPPAVRISDTHSITAQRQSVAFFCNPNQDAQIACLPNCSGPGLEKKYAPVTTENYIVGESLSLSLFDRGNKEANIEHLMNSGRLAATYT